MLNQSCRPPRGSPRGARYLLVAMDYATKWDEVKATKDNTAMTVAKFLFEKIFSQYGCPLEITSDQGSHFVNTLISSLLDRYQIFHRKSCSYYPQANGQAESTNKVLIHLLKKACHLHPQRGRKPLSALCGHSRHLLEPLHSKHLFSWHMGSKPSPPLNLL